MTSSYDVSWSLTGSASGYDAGLSLTPGCVWRVSVWRWVSVGCLLDVYWMFVVYVSDVCLMFWVFVTYFFKLLMNTCWIMVRCLLFFFKKKGIVGYLLNYDWMFVTFRKKLLLDTCWIMFWCLLNYFWMFMWCLTGVCFSFIILWIFLKQSHT